MNRTLLAVVLVSSACGVSNSRGTSSTYRAPIVSCPTSPAAQVFTSALCLCGDYRAVGDGAWVQGGPAGVNGTVEVVGHHEFSDDVIAFGGVHGVGTMTVNGNLSTAAKVEGVGQLTVGKDLSAGLGVANVGELVVKGALRSPSELDSVGSASIAARAPYVPLAGPPCACDPASLLDVKARVEAARASNDDAAAGVPSTLASVGDLSLTLGSGSYFIDRFATVGNATLHIDGVVALFVAGDLKSVGTLSFELTPTATLDLYISGDVEMVGDSMFGQGATAGAVRLYVGGAKGFQMVGGQKVVGAVYAPQADVRLVGDSTFEGALFARNVEGVGKLSIQFAAPVVHQPGSPECSLGGSDLDAGSSNEPDAGASLGADGGGCGIP